MSSFDALRKQLRTLESLIDTKLNAYSRLAVTISNAPSGQSDLEAGPSERWSDMEEEIEGLLEKVRAMAFWFMCELF